MAKETLYEESAQSANAKKESRRYMVFQVIAWALLVLAIFETAIFLTMLLPQILGGYNEGKLDGRGLALNLIIWIVASLMLFAGSYMTFRFRRRFNTSYDYLFVEDELRLTRVFNGRKRKFITTVKMDQIMQIGYCDGDSYERAVQSLGGGKPKILTPNTEAAEGKIFIYLLCSDSAGKIVYVLECRQKLLECLVMAAGRNKFTRE